MYKHTTKYPASLLFRYIKQQGIAYDDICHELADHIICTLEADHTVNEENFYEKLNAFIHSDGMVAMIVSAKEQVRQREIAYRKEIGRGLISVKGILQSVALCLVIYAAFQNEILKLVVEASYVICMLLMHWTIGFSSGIKAFPQHNKLIKQTGFYLAVPVLLLCATYRFMDEEGFLGELFAAVCIACMLSVMLLTWQVNKKHNRKYYA